MKNAVATVSTKMGTKVLAPKSAMNSNTTKPTPTAAAQKRANRGAVLVAVNSYVHT